MGDDVQTRPDALTTAEGTAGVGAGDTPEETAARPSLVSRVMEPAVLDTAREGGRRLWAVMVVLATLGGALGLLQFVAPDKPQSVDSGEIVLVQQARILDMVEQGALSTDDAERLSRALLSGGEADNDDEAADPSGLGPEISRTGTPAQKAAFALLGEPDTRAEGLRTWQAAARTSRDWEMLAELTWNTEPDIALVAVKRALAMDPENIQLLSLMAAIRHRNGEPARARRTIQAALAMAESPKDRLTVAVNLVAFAVDSGDTTDLRLAAHTLERALPAVVAQADAMAADTPLASDAIDDDPRYLRAVSTVSLGRAYAALGQHVEAVELFGSGAALYEAMSAQTLGRDRRIMRARAADAHGRAAGVRAGDGDLPTALAELQTVVDLLEANYAEDPAFAQVDRYTRSVNALAERQLDAGLAREARDTAGNHLALLKGRVRYGIRDVAELDGIISTTAIHHRAIAHDAPEQLSARIEADLSDVAELIADTKGDIRTASGHSYVGLLRGSLRAVAVDAGDLPAAEALVARELDAGGRFPDMSERLLPHVQLARADNCLAVGAMDCAADALERAEAGLLALGAEVAGDLRSRIAGQRAAMVSLQ